MHEETAELIKKGLYYGDLSNGKFDITIGKLSDLWDVSTKALLEKTDASMIPSDDEIKKALTTVDYQNVVVDGNTVTLKDPSAKIDLGGIAKGYIADRMKDYLNQKEPPAAISTSAAMCSVLVQNRTVLPIILASSVRLTMRALQCSLYP